MHEVTIVRHRPGHAHEVPWVRFLLGDLAGEVVEDLHRKLVMPHSLVMCDRLDLVTPEVLRRVREAGTVGLLHTSQQWYRDPLAAYTAYAYVWRSHYYTALRGSSVRQLPVGPAALDTITAEPGEAARRPPAERAYTWSFTGQLKSTRFAMLRALRTVEPAAVHVTGRYDEPGASLDRRAYLDVLADSVFAPCPMGNVHLHSLRAYEALETGTIPIVERRPWFDYYRELLGDHPLPTVRSWSQAPALMRRLEGDEVALQKLQATVVSWWSDTKRRLAEEAQREVRRCLDGAAPTVSLPKIPSRWRGRWEMLRHHNAEALYRRAVWSAKRLRDHGSIRRA